jgi:hypothetical protein
MKLTQSQRDKFVMKNPKNQVVKKEQLAKCMTIMQGHPYIACDISSKMMNYIAPAIDCICENSVEEINDLYFKKSVVSIIIYNTVEKLVFKQPWYPKGGNRAQIVPYTIAKILNAIPSKKSIDFDLIWKTQCLYPSFIHEVEIASYMTHNFLNDSSGYIVREYARRKETWNKYKDKHYELSPEFYADLRDILDVKHEAQQAKKERKFNNDIDAAVEIFSLGYVYWMKVYKKIENERIISTGDIIFVKSIADLINKSGLPSSLQAKRLIKIFNAAEDARIVFE